MVWVSTLCWVYWVLGLLSTGRHCSLFSIIPGLSLSVNGTPSPVVTIKLVSIHWKMSPGRLPLVETTDFDFGGKIGSHLRYFKSTFSFCMKLSGPTFWSFGWVRERHLCFSFESSHFKRAFQTSGNTVIIWGLNGHRGKQGCSLGAEIVDFPLWLQTSSWLGANA